MRLATCWLSHRMQHLKLLIIQLFSERQGWRHDITYISTSVAKWPLSYFSLFSERSGDGSIIGGVLASAFVIAAASLITVIIVVCHITKKRIKIKKLERYQRDIFRRYGHVKHADIVNRICCMHSASYSCHLPFCVLHVHVDITA